MTECTFGNLAAVEVADPDGSTAHFLYRTCSICGRVDFMRVTDPERPEPWLLLWKRDSGLHRRHERAVADREARLVERQAEVREASGPVEVYDVDAVVKMLGTNPGRVYQLIRSGVLPATKLGTSWVIPRASWERWLSSLSRDAERAAGMLPTVGPFSTKG
jgi:excisionase family DNA binding protein